jgi:hypothetical protein
MLKKSAPIVIVAHAAKDDLMAPTASTIALSYLELTATSMGLGCCWAGYFNAAATNFPPMMEALQCLFVLLLIAGCASTKITGRKELVTGQLPRPDRIWVYDFAATPADVPANSALAGQYSEHSTPQTAEQIATGRQLGAEIAKELIKQIRSMGIPAELGGRERNHRSTILSSGAI